jgi:hypothetical protein
MPAIDSLIAATGIVHGLTVVTRNVADMEQSNVKLFQSLAKVKKDLAKFKNGEIAMGFVLQRICLQMRSLESVMSFPLSCSYSQRHFG